ncbi:30S ribosomal protein S24e [Metallosphaera tengchongensis]|uniref:Small ribosomal subunit protein eS24 n=1 Tax=Metallosphaera tengchongensis TaxID=1532350 RepID=A0A6N0NWR2_9CREN|nr:30S ribosomal protein S24e [Metallosphaera tengchongensis]QKQ99787.1 30S ribosomal protein S24e [Metallosphaera tengchongensis]
MSQAQQIKVSEKAEALLDNVAENKVIGRKEVKIKIYHIGSGTPSRVDVKKAISNFLGSKEDLVVVRKIFTSYGAGISEAVLHVYSDKETMERFEPIHLIKRGTKAEGAGEAKNG